MEHGRRNSNFDISDEERVLFVIKNGNSEYFNQVFTNTVSSRAGTSNQRKGDSKEAMKFLSNIHPPTAKSEKLKDSISKTTILEERGDSRTGHQGSLRQAIHLYELARRINEKFYFTNYFLTVKICKIASELNDFENVVKEATNGLRRYSRPGKGFDLLLRRAKAFVSLRKYDQAICDFTQCLRERPESKTVLQQKKLVLGMKKMFSVPDSLQVKISSMDEPNETIWVPMRNEYTPVKLRIPTTDGKEENQEENGESSSRRVQMENEESGTMGNDWIPMTTNEEKYTFEEKDSSSISIDWKEVDRTPVDQFINFPLLSSPTGGSRSPVKETSGEKNTVVLPEYRSGNIADLKRKIKKLEKTMEMNNEKFEKELEVNNRRNKEKNIEIEEIIKSLTKRNDEVCSKSIKWEGKFNTLKEKFQKITDLHREEIKMEEMINSGGTLQLDEAISILTRKIKEMNELKHQALEKKEKIYKETIQKLEEKQNCGICFDQEKNIILFPCYHTLCGECYLKMKEKGECPFCREKIERGVKFF